MDFCKKCVIPSNKEFESKVPKDTLPFHKELNLCDACYQLTKDEYFEEYFSDNNIFKKEFEEFLKSHKKIIFAYSGGLDSTVALHELNKQCTEKGIDLFCFCIDFGFKGNKTLKNIEKVVEFEKLKNFELINICSDITKNNISIFESYKDSVIQNTLPCGKKCNSILDSYYKSILDSFEETHLMTGGDTPKLNAALGRYSIYWVKPQFTVVRGGPSFGLNKNFNQNYVEEHNIPWEHPHCGGYDTDCLLPGAIFKNLAKEVCKCSKDLITQFPIVLDYLSERVRWNIIEKEDAIEKLSRLEISDEYSYAEVMKLIKDKNDN